MVHSNPRPAGALYLTCEIIIMMGFETKAGGRKTGSREAHAMARVGTVALGGWIVTSFSINGRSAASTM